jgi:hypothetical protein
MAMSKIPDAQAFEINHPILKRLEERLHTGQVYFDWNGHYHSRMTQPVVPPEYQWEYRRDFGPEERITDALSHAWLAGDLRPIGKALDKPGKPRPFNFPRYSSLPTCRECSLKLKDWTFDGTTLKCVTPCPHPNGHPAIEVEIDVPSGRLAFDNYFDFAEAPHECGYEGVPEFKWEMEHYAKQNIAHGFCGNTCPSVHKKRDSFIIGRPVYADEGVKAKGFPGHRRIGGIITDAWTWEAIDASKLPSGYKPEFVSKVTPGVYIVRQEYHMHDWDKMRDVPCAYAYIYRKGE